MRNVPRSVSFAAKNAILQVVHLYPARQVVCGSKVVGRGSAYLMSAPHASDPSRLCGYATTMDVNAGSTGTACCRYSYLEGQKPTY